MGKDDYDHCKQGKGLKGNVAGRHMLEIETIRNKKHGSQNAGEGAQSQ